ncbi:MAG: N-formylglutamate amidohydrolase, partial [Hyphomicrobiales bacterium]
MGADEQQSGRSDPPVAITEGDMLSGDFVLVCEHASRFIPENFAGLGLGDKDLEAHITWDIGALALARGLSARLGCGLFHAGYSRLVIDLNRSENAVDLIPEISETTRVPGNCDLAPPERQNRIDNYYTAFHTQLHA